MSVFEEDFVSYDGPCVIMRSLISSLSDGTLTGIRRWFIERHLKDCPRCSNALATLVVIQARLRALGLPKPSEENDGHLKLDIAARNSVQARLDEIDRAFTASEVGE